MNNHVKKKYGTLHRWRRLYLLVGALSVTALSFAQDSTHVCTVPETVEYAAKNSYQVKNALIGISLQQQQNKEITAAAYPQLSGTAGANYYPNVAIQRFPNFIAAAAYGELVD